MALWNRYETRKFFALNINVPNGIVFLNAIRPWILLTHIDDIFIIIEKTFIRTFSKLISLFWVHTKFTYEKENEHNELPFDCLIEINLSGTLNLTIYCKLIYPNQCINFDLPHTFGSKISLVPDLSQRTIKVITSDEDKQKSNRKFQ